MTLRNALLFFSRRMLKPLVGAALAENCAVLTNEPYKHPNFNAEVDKKTGYVTKSVLVRPVVNCRGEKFIIILDGANILTAAGVTERIRLAVMNSVCKFEDVAIRVTMSFGCAEVNPALSIEENVKIADVRLYRAKETGRNLVVSD